MIRTCTTRAAHHAPGRLPVQGVLSAAAITASRWEPGQTITVAFLEPADPALMEEAVAAAKEWMLHANLHFVFVGPDATSAMVRISTVPDGSSWSYVGTQCLAVTDQSEPTMNLGWADDIGRTRHEFGHAADLIHEHQNPLAHVPWNVPAVLAYYTGPPNNWSASEVYTQVLNVDREPLTNGGFDRASVMLYPEPAELLTDPSQAVGWNTDLSAGDKLLASLLYPRAVAPPPPAVVPPAPQPGGFFVNLPSIGQNLINGLGWVRGEVSKEVNLTAFAETVAMAELSNPAAVAAGAGVSLAGKAVLANAEAIFPNPGFRAGAVQLLTDFFGPPAAAHSPAHSPAHAPAHAAEGPCGDESAAPVSVAPAG